MQKDGEGSKQKEGAEMKHERSNRQRRRGKEKTIFLGTMPGGE